MNAAFRAASALAILVSFTAGCGDDGGSTSGGAEGGGGSANASTPASATSGGQGGAMPLEDFVVGGDRPVTVYVPESYRSDTPAPLLILLHGYSAAGNLQEIYFQLKKGAHERGMLYAYPDGTLDGTNKRFWNASEACCDFGATGVDDSAYLAGLIDAIAETANVDPKRVYFVGHSNGGFMSYRMACDHGDRVAAIAALAGTTFVDPAACADKGQVSVLHIHGDADDTVPYEGGVLALGKSIPGAEETLARFAERNGCDAARTDGARLDVDGQVPADETQTSEHAGCDDGLAAELWRIEGGGHLPGVNDNFRNGVLDFLMAHPKP
jgi:polyhydroxybutyrate depolymerase